jgi:hypothetical protein
MKFAGVFESVGAGGWVVDGREVGNEDAVVRILELYRQRDSLRGPLGQAAEDARAQLQVVFRRLLQPEASTLKVTFNDVSAGLSRSAGE